MENLVLREVLNYGPGEHSFRPGDYPWLTEVRVRLRGGDGESDGYAILELFGRAEDVEPGVTTVDVTPLLKAGFPVTPQQSYGGGGGNPGGTSTFVASGGVGGGHGR